MEVGTSDRASAGYWGREGLSQAILDALASSGKDIAALTIDDLAPLDQFHGGGKSATQRLARLAELTRGTRVLDIGGGLGGPARTLAVEFGCTVTVVDLTESYVQAGEMLTARLGLRDRVAHHVGNALELPFDDGAFDVVWMQNSGMNVSDKRRLYAGVHRVLRPGGRFALQEPMAGPVQPLIFPVMWARDASTSFLLTPEQARATIEAAGFRGLVWDDVTTEVSTGRTSTPASGPTIQSIVMGDDLPTITAAQKRNDEERRTVIVQAVFERP